MPVAPDLSGCALDGRYELRAIIGEGAFGRVYEGRDRRLERPVAVKVIKPWWSDDPEWVAVFEREARLLAQLSDPGIVQIFDVGHAPEGLYYVSELVEGENLAARLRRGPLPAWEACAVAAQLCRALACAHAQRIVHRDVKPANILLSTDGRVKVGDFGVARLAQGTTDGHGSHPPSIVGTPRYMAPEQGRGGATTPATDIYSVGVVCYEMLSGAPPFAAGSVVELALRHLEEPPPPLSARLPTSLVAIVQRALAKDPQRRYRDGAEMAEALLQARRNSTRPRPPRRERPAPARTRNAGAHGGQRALVAASARTGLASRGAQAPPRVPPETPGWLQPAPAPPLPPPPAGPHGTKRAAPLSARRNVNPAARRRAIAAVALVVALLGAMVAAAVLIGHTKYTHVPSLLHRSKSGALAALRRAHLRASTGTHYAMARAGTVVGESPGGHTRVAQGSTVHLTISRGPAPVHVLNVTGQSASDAERTLKGLGLHPAVQYIPAPAARPGTVVGQTPAHGDRPRGSRVTLRVAEVPRWHAVTTFTGRDSGTFHIIGRHWRVVYRMGFEGTCTWIVFCSGPSARVVDATTGRYQAGFGLANGTGQVRSFTTGPGSYAIAVTPGGDTAGWSLQVQDLY